MISIIIPVFNEAATIGKSLSHLVKACASQTHISEIIVVDGGSTDGTMQEVLKFSNKIAPRLKVHMLPSQKGRAKQMNAGAKIATGSIFYFLHADSLPPKGFDHFILQEIKKGNPAGCFKMKFDSIHFWLIIAAWFTQFSWRACRGGDQSLFIRRELFEEIGGYDENYIIYEDNILINELYDRKKFVIIQKPIITSSRRYREKGVWNLQFHYFVIYFKKWLGADADTLYSYYSKHIKSSKNQSENKKFQEVVPEK